MRFPSECENIIWAVGAMALAVLAGLIVHRVLFGTFGRIAARTVGAADDLLVKYASAPAKLILPVTAALLATHGLPVPLHAERSLRHFLTIVLIGGATWLLIALLGVMEDLIAERHRADATNLAHRSIKTQVHVLRRVAAVVLTLVGFAVMLMTFPAVWNIGASLFASAGAAGIIIGLAAKPTVSSLLAGIQIALTEPIRLDDSVVVEGEWGTVEEISSTYVVIRIWDQRRLIVPLSYFIERPFQNWTRSSTEILGTVFLYVDYTVPVDDVRAELHRILQSADLWDGRVWNLQVTNATERSVELRALMSARDAGKAWDLRCNVRERLIDFVQKNYPDALPRTRADLPAAMLAADQPRPTG